ncbi:MAG: fibronectin type III domain-containing protein [Bryobacteraceae bacterium]
MACLTAAICVTFSVSCGYIGPVVPPSPLLPSAITDLKAVERGNQLSVSFSTPPRTTDGRAIKKFSKVDLVIGPVVHPWNFAHWSQTAKHHELPPPPPNDPNAPLYHAMQAAEPISAWVGQTIAVAVRTAVKEKDHFSPWSNYVVLKVIPPLKPPVVKAQASAGGYRLTWHEEKSGMHFDIYRQGPSDKAPIQIGTTKKPEYLDATSQWNTRYAYTIIALLDAAESLPSQPVRVMHADTFPAAVPTGLTALATPSSIELSWQRVSSANLKGYYVYRSVSGGPFVRVGGLLTLPAYADQAVEHGKTYRYEVSSISQKGYESAQSAPTQTVTFP